MTLSGTQVDDLVKEENGAYAFKHNGRRACSISVDQKTWWGISNPRTVLLRRASMMRYWSRKDAYAVAREAVGETHQYSASVRTVLKQLGMDNDDTLPEAKLEIVMMFAAHRFEGVEPMVRAMKRESA